MSIDNYMALFEVDKGIEGSSCLLTTQERAVWRLLKNVDEKEVWGKSIQQVRQNPKAPTIKQLLKELKEQAIADPVLVRSIVGPLPYEALLHI